MASVRSSSQKGNAAVVTVVAVLIVGILAFFIYRSTQTSQTYVATDTTLPTTPPSQPTTFQSPTANIPANPPSNKDTTSVATPPAATTPARKKYTDGTYTADGTYTIPDGQETITVSLTLKDGIITDANFTGNPTERQSKFNEEKFAAGYRAEVVGKDIDRVNLTVVNGSSLTPMGFMDALAKIKTEAAAKA